MRPLAKLLLPMAFLGTVAGMSPAAEQSKKTQSRPTGIFRVNVTDGYLSLDAEEAPLPQILREIARQARITINSNIGPEEKITTRLDRVPLEDGIKQLAKNVSVFYAQSRNGEGRRIERVVILSEVKERPPAQPKASSQPAKSDEAAPQAAPVKKPSQQAEPFKFEFDPGKVVEKKEAPRK